MNWSSELLVYRQSNFDFRDLKTFPYCIFKNNSSLLIPNRRWYRDINLYCFKI